MFPPNTTPGNGSTSTTTQTQTTQTQPEYLTKDEFSRSAAFIRGLSEKVEALTKSMPTMDTFVALGMLEKADDGTYKPKAAAAPAPKTNTTQNQPDQIAEMESRFQAELKKRDEALAAERRKAAETELRGAVVEALNKAGAVNASRDFVHMRGVTRNTAGQFVQVIKDEFGADKEVSLDDAAGNFLKSNPELKKAAAHSGSGVPGNSGTTGSTGSAGVTDIANMSMDQYFAARKAGKL